MKTPAKSRKRIIRRIFLTIIVLLLLTGAGFYGYSMLKQEYTVTYDSYTATTGSISNALSFSGNLSLVDSMTYTASSASTVRTIYVDVGDDVKEGDRLVRLSNGQTIEADFDGRVNAVSVEEDDQVSAGQVLVQVADFTHMQIALRVDEYDIADVSVGQSCTVTATAAEKSFESSIDSIDYISASAGSVAYYTAVAYVDVDEGIYPGMQVSVTIPQEEAADVVILKSEALSFDDTNQAFVWMKDSAGEMEQVPVETGVTNGNYVEIVSGISDGDEVYVETKEESPSAMSGLLSGIFGSQQINENSYGGRGGMDKSGFTGDRGSMPDMGGAPDAGGMTRPGGGN